MGVWILDRTPGACFGFKVPTMSDGKKPRIKLYDGLLVNGSISVL